MLRWLARTSDRKFASGTGQKYAKHARGFLWIHAVNPTANELNKLKRDFNIHEKIIEKFWAEKRTIKYLYRPLTFTLVDYYVDKGKIAIENVLFIGGEHFLITITKKSLPHYERMFSHVRERIQDFKSIGYLLHELLDWDAEENFDVLKITENRISELEKAVLTPEQVREKIDAIVNYKRYLLQIWRRMWSNSKIVFTIKKGMTPIKIDAELMRQFDHIHDMFLYQMDIVTTQREVLTDALTIYETVLANRLASISNRINSSIKKLTFIMFLWTAVAVILSIPNTIATVLGIPEWPLSVDAWGIIATILLLSMIIPTIWFYVYWKKLKTEA